MSKKNKNRNKHNNIVEYPEKDHSKYYLWIVKVGIVVCLFLPLLIVYSHMYAMQVGKVLVFRTIIEIITFFYIILIIKKEEYRPKWGLFELSITLFLFIYLLASLTGENFLRSFWGTASRMGGFFTMLHFWAYFLILISVFKTKNEWKFLFGTSILVSLISSLFAFGQSVFFWRTVLPWIELSNAWIYSEIEKYVTQGSLIIIDEERPFGTIGNAGLFTAYVLYNLFLGLYLFGTNKAVYKKILIFISVLFLFAILFLAGSRSSIMADLAGLFVLTLVYVASTSNNKIQIFSMVLIIAMFLGSSYIFLNKDQDWIENNYILERFASISLNSDETRTMTWESSWKGFLERPVLGAGPENYNIVFDQHFNPLHFKGYGSTTWYDRAHNIFFDILTTMGIVGLASYLSIFAIIYLFLMRNRHRARENLPAFALMASLPVAYFVQNLFWFDDFSSYLMLFLFFAFVSNFWNEEFSLEYNVQKGNKIIDFVRRKLGIESVNNRGEQIFMFIKKSNTNKVMAIFGILMVLSIYYTNVRVWNYHSLSTLSAVAFKRNASDSFLWYRKAMDNSTYLGSQELYRQLGDYVNVQYALSNSEDPKERQVYKENLKFAISEMETAVKENKKDVQFYSLLGALYNKYYSEFREEVYIAKAEETLKKAVELSPERETIYYEYGQTMVYKKDYNMAIELFKKGIELNPTVPISHWYLGLTYLNAKEYNLADTEITEALKLGYGRKIVYGKIISTITVNDLLNIVPIYIALNDFSMVEKLYLEILDIDPNKPEIYASLALVYKELGDNSKAIEMAKKAISLDEKYKGDAEKFIEELEK